MKLRILLCFWLATSIFAQGVNETRKRTTIAPGLEHSEIKRGDFAADKSDRWTIQIIEIDPRRYRLQLGLAMDEVVGAETTSSLALRYSALAAVNGGYFRTTGIYRGEQMGALYINGKTLSEPVQRRAALAVSTQGEYTIVNLSAQTTLTVNGKVTHSVNGINRPRGRDELVVFTPEFHRTTLTAPDGVETVVHRNRVNAIYDKQGSQLIPPNGLILSAHGAARDWLRTNLRKGARVTLKTKLEAIPALSFSPAFILGAGPRLLADGQFVFSGEADHYSQSLFQSRHPRTALGWRTDKTLVLVVVDGRQPQHSVGMTLAELAELMHSLGCVTAMNLDGGGSSTMVMQHKIVNRPSDSTGERAVSDALLVVPR